VRPARALRLSLALENGEQAHRLFIDSARQPFRLHERGSRTLRYLRRDFRVSAINESFGMARLTSPSCAASMPDNRRPV